VRPWLVAAIWLAWWIITAGAGYARPQPGDRIDHRATRVSVLADLTLVVSMVGAVAAAIAVPSAALPADPWLTVALGSALVLVGVALRQWAARTLGRYFTRSVLIREGHGVITSGPYRAVRHPGYAGVLVAQVGLALTLGNWLSLGLMVIGFLLAHIPRITAEEAVLEESLGEQYRDYERTRKRLIPGVW
jgi:protein-S-isoprenylcysteine O-methyltransferase Ste14